MIRVVKADGTSENFDPHKLLGSLERAGADRAEAHDIAQKVEHGLYNGIPTQEIYRRAFADLRHRRRGAAARYSLKRAVMEFGPSGFPFEAYIAELLRAEGWQAKTDQIVEGACVEHEVDVVALRGSERLFVEAKFHNAAGFKTDVKVALYVKSRVDDIAAALKSKKQDAAGIRGMVVTNTKFTSHAVRYAQCAGLELLAWEYPRHHNLHDRIDAAGLYPITALTTLGHREKTELLQRKVVLCNSLPHHTQTLAEVGLTPQKASAVLEEVGALCVPAGNR